MSRILVSLSVLLLALPALATDITRDAVVASMNAQRAQQGLPPLRIDDRLCAAAGDRMREMEEMAYWDHVSPEGRSPFAWLKPRGYDFRYAGENLAKGFETAEVLVESWMESRGHRENIMSPLYNDCGIAIIDGSTLGRATGKSVVVLFGRAATTERPSASGQSPR